MKSVVLWTLFLGVVGFVPLFGGPRYEAALVAGLVGPLWCAVVSVRAAQTLLGRREGGPELVTGLQLLGACLAVGANHLGALVLVATVHGLRVGFCEPAEGYAFLALGPGVGMLLASALAGVTTFIAKGVPGGSGKFGSIVAMMLSLAFPLGAVFLGLLHFYGSPSVFAYSPFVGHFAGPLYDTVVYDLPRLLAYRGGTLLTLIALGSAMGAVGIRFGSAGMRAEFLPRTKERISLLFFGVLCAAGSLSHAVAGESMGTTSSAESIQKTLGRSLERGRCRLFFSAGVDQAEARRLGAECVGHLAQLEDYFGVEGFPGVDVYVFASAEEKRLQMGAATTYIAKPWRREIYIQPGGFPHQVLGHELAHVLTGHFGQGPLRVAGPLGGIVPDPGRIEGFAEAASPREDSEGTLHEWTAAMKQLELLPRLDALFQLSFLGSSPARAYSAAGSFVDFVRTKHGAEALRKWYGGAALPEVVGKSWEALEGEWHEFLDGIQVPTEVLEIARPRFSRPSVFERRCPHAVDREVDKAHAYCGTQERRANKHAERAIALDPAQRDLELTMHRCAYYAGDADRSFEALTHGAGKEEIYAPAARRSAFEFSGNIAWSRGTLPEAAQSFQKARELTFGRDAARNLDVKLWALQQKEAVREPLRLLLAPRPDEGKNAVIALTRWLEDGPEHELARYLLARHSAATGAWSDARKYTAELEVSKLPLDALQKEAGRMKLLDACETAIQRGPTAPLTEALTSYRAQKLSRAEELEAKRLTERCTVAAKKESP